MNTELKPCPFCGSKAETYIDFDYCYASVLCTKCDVYLYDESSDIPKVNELRAIQKWNRRTK